MAGCEPWSLRKSIPEAVALHMNISGSPKIKVIFYGVGAIGSQVAKFGLSRPGLEVVGAIDADPDKIGLDLGTVLGL